VKDFSIELVKEWDSDFRHASSHRKKRLQKLLDRLDIEFPVNGLENNIQRASINALIWALLDGAIMLYSLGMNGQALVELQGILERICIREIIARLSHNNADQEHVMKELIERKSLVDLAIILNKLAIWNNDDMKYVTEINKLRNGVAHRNPKLVNVNSFLNIDSALKNVDMISYIIQSIRLLNKLFVYSQKKG
jgi:hypothetical protein